MNETREGALGNETFARLLGAQLILGMDILKNWRENSGYHPTDLLTILHAVFVEILWGKLARFLEKKYCSRILVECSWNRSKSRRASWEGCGR